MSRSRTLLFFGLMLGTLGCDQGTKRFAESTLKGAEPMALLHGSVRLVYAENSGAWGSLGADWPDLLRTILLIGVPLVFLVAMALYAWVAKPGKWQLAGLALLVGGGAGNLIDRMVDGHVVDFLYLGVGGLGTNIFNVADVALLAGIALVYFPQRRATET